MYLSRLYIENYRSIKKLDLKFEKGKNIIVGKNNSGKSNIIKAINLILGENSPTWDKSENITDNDFFGGDTNNEIFIWCELKKDVGEIIDFSSIKGAFMKILKNNSDYRISINFSNRDEIFYLCTNEGKVALDDDRSGFKKKWIGDTSYCRGRTLGTELNNIGIFSFAFRARKIGDSFVKEMIMLFRENESHDWMIMLTYKLRNELLQSAIIPSFRDPKDQLRIANYTWYGKLLRAYIKEDDADLNDAFDTVKKASNKLFKELQGKIYSEKTRIAFPNTRISFQFNPDSKQDIYKSALIYVNDGFNSRLDEKGSGIQSSVIIGLFHYYIRNIAHSSGSLLAIEEPELYLHPHGKRVVSDNLDIFLEGGKNQVIITTHSPEFICCPDEKLHLIFVKKDGTETKAKNLRFNETKKKQILIKKQNAEMFFADAVILVEGADKYVLDLVAEKFGIDFKIIFDGVEKQLGKNWLNEQNVSIISCGGKMEFWKYIKIFKDLNIPWFIIADFDFLREGLNDFFTKLEFEQEDIDKLNSLKARITITGRYKSISDISPENLIQGIKSYISDLSVNFGIYILTGELENFYIQQPKFDKEFGVIETISKSIEENKPITEFIKTDEFYDGLKLFAKNCLKLDLIEERDT